MKATVFVFAPLLAAVFIEAQKEANLWAAEQAERIYKRARERFK